MRSWADGRKWAIGRRGSYWEKWVCAGQMQRGGLGAKVAPEM